MSSSSVCNKLSAYHVRANYDCLCIVGTSLQGDHIGLPARLSCRFAQAKFIAGNTCLQSNCSIQDLLERHMGMQLTDMQQFVTLSIQARQQQTLPGSYLPPKGYYRVKTNSRQQLQRQSWLTSSLRTLPSCFGLSSSDKESISGNLGRASVGSDGSTQPSTDMPTVIEVSLLGEELEDATAAGNSQLRSG